MFRFNFRPATSSAQVQSESSSNSSTAAPVPPSRVLPISTSKNAAACASCVLRRIGSLARSSTTVFARARRASSSNTSTSSAVTDEKEFFPDRYSSYLRSFNLSLVPSCETSNKQQQQPCSVLAYLCVAQSNYSAVGLDLSAGDLVQINWSKSKHFELYATQRIARG